MLTCSWLPVFAGFTDDARQSHMNQNLSSETPYLVVEELEPDGVGGQIATTTIFLTASTCPIGCAMCDLHLNTLPHATPRGAIPQQIDAALEGRSRHGWLKLYNSGNFFDRQAIPLSDHGPIAGLVRKFETVIVENHLTPLAHPFTARGRGAPSAFHHHCI